MIDDAAHFHTQESPSLEICLPQSCEDSLLNVCENALWLVKNYSNKRIKRFKFLYCTLLVETNGNV